MLKYCIQLTLIHNLFCIRFSWGVVVYQSGDLHIHKHVHTHFKLYILYSINTHEMSLQNNSDYTPVFTKSSKNLESRNISWINCNGLKNKQTNIQKLSKICTFKDRHQIQWPLTMNNAWQFTALNTMCQKYHKNNSTIRVIARKCLNSY